MSVTLDTLAPTSRDHPARAAARQAALERNRRLNVTWRDHGSLAARTVHYLWPWSRRNYPGLRAGIVLTLGVAITWPAVLYWLLDRQRVPLWAAEALRDALFIRAEVGARLVAEWDADIASRRAEVRHQQGKLRGRATDD